MLSINPTINALLTFAALFKLQKYSFCWQRESKETEILQRSFYLLTCPVAFPFSHSLTWNAQHQ